MKVKDLKPAGYNPRKITKAQLERLKKSLEEFGDLSGIVFNINTQTLIGGHQRTKIIEPSWPIVKEQQADATGTVAAGYIDTPHGRLVYREVDWPLEKEKAANIAANAHGGDFDNIALKDLIEEIKLIDIDMDLIGFDDQQIINIFKTIPDLPPGASTPLNKNFNAQYGGGTDDENRTAASTHTGETMAMKYPLTFILEEKEVQLWNALKQKINIKSDKLAFLKIIGGENA